MLNTSLIKNNNNAFADAVIEGLNKTQKQIPSRYLYDKRGSELFEDITDLEEYYPTRTEISILKEYDDEITELSGDNVNLIEFGSGSSKKTKILIRAIEDLQSYIPIDISKSALDEAEKELQNEFPDLDISTLHADFNKPVTLPVSKSNTFLLGFFPGSTLGNFEYTSAVTFLKNVKKILGKNSALLIGIDLQKDPDVLIPAYDDASGVTASFNLNLLERINKELDADFNLEAYEHKAIYNDKFKRIEMHIISLKDQAVTILGNKFIFDRGETIHTENSHKYTIKSFSELAESGGWKVTKHWTDGKDLFSLHYLTPM